MASLMPRARSWPLMTTETVEAETPTERATSVGLSDETSDADGAGDVLDGDARRGGHVSCVF